MILGASGIMGMNGDKEEMLRRVQKMKEERVKRMNDKEEVKERKSED
jgi:hypothetical protein